MCTRGVRIGGDIRRGGQNAKTWRKIAQINSMPGGREDQAHTQPGQESPELSSLGRKPLTILSESPNTKLPSPPDQSSLLPCLTRSDPTPLHPTCFSPPPSSSASPVNLRAYCVYKLIGVYFVGNLSKTST